MSHTYRNLKQKIGSNITEMSSTAALKIPLIHCIRALAIEDLKSIAKKGFLLGDTRTNRGKTKVSNSLFSIPNDSVYFYAGRAFFDDHAFVYLIIHEKNGNSIDGNSVPFDSGGLAHSLLKITRNKLTEKEKKQYYLDHAVKSSEFREYLSYFFEEFFDEPCCYWDGVPKKTIDEQTTPFIKSDWKNWTFEIVSYHKMKINNVIQIILDDSVGDFFLTQWDNDFTEDIKYSLMMSEVVSSDLISDHVDKKAREITLSSN